MIEGVNSTMIYCKNFCKCHDVPLGQQYLKKEKLKWTIWWIYILSNCYTSYNFKTDERKYKWKCYKICTMQNNVSQNSFETKALTSYIFFLCPLSLFSSPNKTSSQNICSA
jgi:hypothetical protein